MLEVTGRPNILNIPVMPATRVFRAVLHNLLRGG